MKILLVWSENEPEMRVIFDALLKDGHEIVYWVGEYVSEPLTPPGTVFHDHFEAWGAMPARVLENEHIEPASTHLIDSMAHIESHILTMMNKRYDKASVDERKHVYFTMLSYWNYCLERYKPDCIMYGVVPHGIYSNVIYEMAQKRGIKTICMEDTWIGTHTLVYKDFWKGSDELRAEIKKLEGKSISEDGLCDFLQEYWKIQTTPQSRLEPVYMTDQKKLLKGWGRIVHRAVIALRTLRNGTLPYFLANYVVRLFKRDLTDEYAEVVQKPDWNVSFVYFPLNFQPERTSSPQAGVFADMLLVAETLAVALPAGWELWVKEHPSQWMLRSTRFSSVRYPGYYHRLAKIPNVRVVPIKTDTFTLTEKASAVAVTTGTAGWEALLKGKRPLMFGIPWWRDCPGVYRVDSAASCRGALREIQNGARADKQDVLRFLVAVEKVCIHAHIEPPEASWKTRDHVRNIPAVVERLCDELRAMES
ncbi:MAG: hypothetical protein Q8R25_01910 [bacterium]|nr:hypothetical protein [bacterium]